MTAFDGRSTASEVVGAVDIGGMRIVITGATSGIGFETARALAAGGAGVTIAARDHARNEQAAAEIRRRHPAAVVSTIVLDLASLASIREAAHRHQDSLDVLICNAGAISGGYTLTDEGFERTVGVCHVGHFLLTHLLFPQLQRAGGRVVVVASESHRSPPKLDFERLPLSQDEYSPMVAYGQAKLCNVLFANELERRAGGHGVHANSLHPGTMISTGIGRGWWAARLAMMMARPFTRSVQQAAATPCYVATAPELEGVGGKYFDRCSERPASAEACDSDVAARLWSLSEEWAGLLPAERIPLAPPS